MRLSPGLRRYVGHDPVLLWMGTLKGCCASGIVEAGGPEVVAVEGTELEMSASWHQPVALQHRGYPARQRKRRETEIEMVKLGAVIRKQKWFRLPFARVKQD